MSVIVPEDKAEWQATPLEVPPPPMTGAHTPCPLHQHAQLNASPYLCCAAAYDLLHNTWAK